jgi:hypothetical protein
VASIIKVVDYVASRILPPTPCSISLPRSGEQGVSRVSGDFDGVVKVVKGKRRRVPPRPD